MTEERQSGRAVLGALARFGGPAELLEAVRKMRESGFSKYNCHSPFPIHGMDAAMGERRSGIGWITGFFAICGGGGALLLQGWSATTAYPLVISGKPFFSYQAFFPITFALAVLVAAFAALFGFLAITGVRLHHPVFFSDNFKRFSDDGFFVSVDATDSKFDADQTCAFLRTLGGIDVELLEAKS